MASSRVRISDLIKKKADGQKIVMLTAYDYITAALLDEAGIDIVLIGDSLGNVFSGYENTLPVTLDQMIYHTKAVVRGCSRALVVMDMPFMSYHVSLEQARANVGRVIQESHAQAVKIEVLGSDISVIKSVLDMGVAVMGHLGFTPQAVHKLGGYKVQGRKTDEADRMLDLAKQLEAAGCFALVLEMVPRELAQQISESISIPVIGIGAGPDCDGQVLVTQDILGLTRGHTPKFVKQYAGLSDQIRDAVKRFKTDVESGRFPDAGQGF